ncbi:putative reverse transcriptase domain-containing protein [Tanacetum coccineum]
MEQYMSKTRGNYGSGVARPKINDKTYFELKGQFLKELRENTFSGSEHEDANEHNEKVLEIIDLFHILEENLKSKFLNKYCPPARTAKKMEELNNFQQELDESLFRAWERFKELLMKCPQHYLTDMQEVILFYNGLDVPTRQILDSKGVIPTKTVADAKVAIQEMVEYSQKWHNGTSTKTKSTKTSDGLASIQAQLNSPGREIKKVNEKVYAAQVGCELCKGPHYTKDCPLKEEGKTLEEAYYTRREENSNIIKEIRASTDAAIINQGTSIKTLEIQIGQMSKVLQERGFESLPNSMETNLRDHVKLISTAKAYSTGICRASVSVMPFSTYTNLGLGDLAHTRLTIELADRTIKHPRGIVENMLVRIGKFIFPIDLIILDIPEDNDDKGDHEMKKLAGTLIDIPIFVGNFSIIPGFLIIDDMDVTSGVVLDMPFCKKFVTCQKIIEKFVQGDECE